MDMSAIDPAFALKLARFIRYNTTTEGCDWGRADELAQKFKVQIKDLKSWANGDSSPPPMKQKEISEYLGEQSKKGRV